MTSGPGAAVGGGPLRVGEALERLPTGRPGVPGRCAPSAERRRDMRFGTASPTPRWLLVEQPGGWGPEALLDSTLDPAVGAELVRRWEHRAGIRVVLIRRPGRRSVPARKAWAVVDSRAGRERVGWGSWTDPAELLDLPVGAEAGERGGGPLYLVCAHGRHDPCCAIRGRPVAEALAAARPGAVWECSHVGGDRFAANVVALPHGLFYAHVTTGTAAEIAAAYERGQVRPDLLRGRSAFAPPAQAAQHYARLELGETAVDALRPLGLARLAERSWRVRLAKPPGTLLVTVRAAQAPPARLTCGSARAERPRAWELVGIEPA
jgi:Sucrase/ferredoxin-like